MGGGASKPNYKSMKTAKRENTSSKSDSLDSYSQTGDHKHQDYRDNQFVILINYKKETSESESQEHSENDENLEEEEKEEIIRQKLNKQILILSTSVAKQPKLDYNDLEFKKKEREEFR